MVAAAARILVLGVVHVRGQAHGYQVRRELLGWRADTWAKIAPGSIYQALRTLSKHGLLEPVGTEAGERGPERTVYRMTPDGETEFFHLLRVAITDPGAGPESLNAAFAFLNLLTRAELPDLFGYRVRELRARLTTTGPDEGSPLIKKGTPPQIADLGRLYGAQLQAEIEWSLGMLDKIRDGAYWFAEDSTVTAAE